MVRMFAISLLFALICRPLVAEEVELADVPAKEFLQVARRPFLQNAWARLSGTVQRKDRKRVIKVPLRLSVLMHPDYLRAQFIMDDKDVYNVTQAYAESGPSNVRIDLPDEFKTVKIEDLGVALEDITFSFLYWDFVEEQDRDTIRGQKCRVMKLRNPKTLEHVIVFFSIRHVGPLKVEHFSGDSTTPVRSLEFSEFKREGDLYYVKAARLEGPGWKTMVKFREADLALTKDRAPPDNLFIEKPE